MELAASHSSTRTRERSRQAAQKQGEQAGPAAAVTPETSTLVSIYRCDSEMRVSEVMYSDHVADPSQYIGGTDYDWLPSDEADAMLALKQRAVREQRIVRDKLTLTFQGKRHTFRIAVFPEKEKSEQHVITVVVTEILDVDQWLRLMDLPDEPGREPELPRIGFVRMDNSTRTILGPVRNVRLSGTEWRLLRQLSSAHGGVVSHDQLLSAIWGSGYRTAHHLLHDAVSRLRHRFSAAGLERSSIETVHGVGYRLQEEGEVF
jgi:hypothetical protein